MQIRSVLPAVAICAFAATLLSGCSANNAATKLLGVPSPEQQRVLREELVARMPEARVLVLPVYFRDRDAWVGSGELAKRLEPFAREVAVSENPPDVKRGSVPPTSYRYAGKRSEQYRAWLRSTAPDADFVIVPEIYTVRIPRAQLFVFDREGRVMQMSSVHWGHDPPRDDSDAAERIVARFSEGMERR